MLFRDNKGKLVDIKKLDYVRDSDYYRAIIIAKKKELPETRRDEKKRICSFF